MGSRRTESGQAAPLAIVAVGIVFLLLSSLTVTVAGTVRDSRSGLARQEARVVAEAGVEEFFSHLIADPDYLRDGTTYKAVHPVIRDGGWWYFDPDGRLATCPTGDRLVGCFQLGVTFDTAVQNGVIIQSIGSAYCNTTARTVCAATVGLRSVVRRRSFLEFLIHADSESLEPAALPAVLRPSYPVGCDRQASDPSRPVGCFDAAYHGRSGQVTDTVDGPIHSNDSRILICGQPRFTNTIEVFTGVPVGSVLPGAPGYPWRPATDPGCSLSGPNAPQGGTFVNGPALSLPFEGGPTEIFARARAIAGSGTNAASYDVAGPAAIEVVGSGVRINGGANLPLPDSGVLYVRGDAQVSGVLNGRLSIVAEGNIEIIDNLTYACGGLGAAGFNTATCRDAMGLNARGSITIRWRPTDLTIHAAMASVQRSVFVDRWLDSDYRNICTISPYSAMAGCSGGGPLARPPTLFVRGAIVGHYRGVYGAYNTGAVPSADGSEGYLISGFSKDFAYDSRFKDTIQPPYFVEPVSAAWARIDEVEVTAASTGITGSPAPTGPTTSTTAPTTTAPTTTAPTTTAPTTTAPTTTAPTTTAPTTTTTTCILPGILC